MHTLRMPLMGWVIVMLVASLSMTVLVQSDIEESMRVPTEFSGRLSCPGAEDWQRATVTDVVLGPMGEDDLVRREARGGFFHPVVDEMSDDRFKGTWTAYLDSDEYIYPSIDMQDHPMLMTGKQRIENGEGAWQGSVPDAIVPEAP